MRILTWNIQWAKGMDGRVDPERIAQEIERLSPDVVALQEVCKNYPANTGDSPPDQPEWFARRFRSAGYQAVFGAAVDTLDDVGEPRQFGNLVLTRFPVQRILRHALPHPPDPENPGSARSALEVMLAAPDGPLRFTTTHLSYHSERQRRAQIDYLRRRHAEASLWTRYPALKPEIADTPMRTPPESLRAILCGDFNAAPGDGALQRLSMEYSADELEAFGLPSAAADDAVPLLHDAWRAQHPDLPHAPTLSVHDPQRSAICFDYLFASANLTDTIEGYEVIEGTQASDHQPCLITLGMTSATE